MPVTLDQLLAMRERLIREIASGKRGTPESRVMAGGAFFAVVGADDMMFCGA